MKKTHYIFGKLSGGAEKWSNELFDNNLIGTSTVIKDHGEGISHTSILLSNANTEKINAYLKQSFNIRTLENIPKPYKSNFHKRGDVQVYHVLEK